MILLKLVNHQALYPNWARGNKSMIIVEWFVMINRVLRVALEKRFAACLACGRAWAQWLIRLG